MTEVIKRCLRKSWKEGGCNFEAQYNLGPTTITEEQIEGLALSNFDESSAVTEILDSFRAKTFVGIFCTVCGKRGGEE